MKKMTVDEFRDEATKRFGNDPRNWKFVCPMCGTIQSIQELLDAVIANGGKKEDVNGYVGFSCIGRFTGQNDVGIREHQLGNPWNRGCNWTLGGLLQTHTLEVIFPNGNVRPTFELAY